jgi:hypothetical protein
MPDTGCVVMSLWEFTEISKEYRQAASGMEEIWDWFWKICEKKELDVDKEASSKQLYEWVGDGAYDSDVYEIIADGEIWHYMDVEMGEQNMAVIISNILVTTGPNVPLLGHQFNGIRYEDGNEWSFGELYFLDRDKIIEWVEKNGMGGVNLSNLINWR